MAPPTVCEAPDERLDRRSVGNAISFADPSAKMDFYPPPRFRGTKYYPRRRTNRSRGFALYVALKTDSVYGRRDQIGSSVYAIRIKTLSKGGRGVPLRTLSATVVVSCSQTSARAKVY